MTVDPAHNWLVIGVAAVAILVIAFVATEDAAVSRRVFQRFVFNIALPLMVLVGLPLLLWASTSDLDPRLLQALVAGLVIAAGWLTTAIFSELEKARAKSERLRDVHKALYAEIRDVLAILYDDGRAEVQAAQIQDTMQNDPAFVPFIPLDLDDRVFQSVLPNIEVLPRQTIDSIVQFYSLVSSVRSMAQDLRSERFLALEDQVRRIALYRTYFDMRTRAYAAGLITLNVIGIYAEKGADVAEAYLTGLNTPAEGQSAPEAGRE